MLQCAAVLAHPVARHKVLVPRRRGDLIKLTIIPANGDRALLFGCVTEQLYNGFVSSLAGLLVIGKNQIADFNVFNVLMPVVGEDLGASDEAEAARLDNVPEPRGDAARHEPVEEAVYEATDRSRADIFPAERCGQSAHHRAHDCARHRALDGICQSAHERRSKRSARNRRRNCAQHDERKADQHLLPPRQRECAVRVGHHDGVVIAVGVQVQPVGLRQRIAEHVHVVRRDESARFGVVVTAVQVVQPGLRIVIVPAVAERVDLLKFGTFLRKKVAPGVVLIHAAPVPAAVVDLNDIALQVLAVVVLLPVVLKPCNARIIVVIVDDRAAALLRKDLIALDEVLRRPLLDSDARVVVGERRRAKLNSLG